jgi:hypothetical protein
MTFIKHKKYRDVCCQVLKRYDFEHKMKLKIMWWNLGCEKSWCMGYQQNIVIMDGELKDWEMTNDEPVCLRDANWRNF